MLKNMPYALKNKTHKLKKKVISCTNYRWSSHHEKLYREKRKKECKEKRRGHDAISVCLLVEK